MKRLTRSYLALHFLVILLVGTAGVDITLAQTASPKPSSAASESIADFLSNPERVTSFGHFIAKDLPQDFAEQEGFRHERIVGKGVKFVSEFHEEGPYYINYLTVDLNAPYITLEAEKAKDTLLAGERVQEIAQRESSDGHYVVAAVNGDFWRSGYCPTGLLVDDGRIYNSPSTNRSVFVCTAEGKPFIGKYDFSTTLTTSKGSCGIDAINFIDKGKDLVLFTPARGDSTPKQPERTEVVVEMETDEFLPNKQYSGEVVSVKKNSSATAISGERWVLSAAGEKGVWLAKNLRHGDEIEIGAGLAGIDEPIAFVVGGGPRLLSNGEVDIDRKRDHMGESFITTRHPRTAIGFSEDKRKIFLMTVDGRQPLVSIGFDLYTLANYMKALGAYDAMNLDGGGSSTMWVRGAVLNKPSDISGPRIVSNALLVVSRSKVGELAHLEISPRFARVPVNASVQFEAFGTDYNYNPIALDKGSLHWYATEGIGEIGDDGLLRASATPAEGTVMVRSTEKRVFCSVPVRVEEIERVEVKPAPVVLRRGESEQIRIGVFNRKGDRMSIPADGIRFDLPAELVWHPEKSSISGIRDGRGEFTVSVGEYSQAVPFTVGTFETRIVESFDDLPEGGEKTLISGKLYDTERTRVSVNKEEKKQGDASLKLDYSMKRGGLTVIYLNLNAPIPGSPVRLAMWVYGDGKGHWLRGEAKDKDDELFILDFTEGGKGVSWDGEWRYLEIDGSKIVPKWTNAGAKIDFPMTLERIYLAQGQEAKKSDGTLMFDSLEALYFPSD